MRGIAILSALLELVSGTGVLTWPYRDFLGA